ncbi:guanyl nucleotide binding protein [Coprinopsis sp. MPI-PUGE-AT-0042]|nr:guanyl nucleotide binding protein [Coprinopsis sp. MPI-PUGE-AT-0042]
MTEQDVQWTPPYYRFHRLEDSGREGETSHNVVTTYDQGNFARNARWTPDGSAFLVQCEDHTLQIFGAENLVTGGQKMQKPLLSAQQASPVVATQWFPAASRSNPASFCFVASVRECPVKLLDANDGRLRASYPIVDHRERQIAPHSLAFTYAGDKLYCGFEDAIEVFDVARPGDEGTRLHTTPIKKSKDGLRGIVAALAFSTAYGDSDTLFAAGSLSPNRDNIALFMESQGGTPVMSMAGGPRAGVVQLHFNPYRPHILYAGYRDAGSGLIYSWDIRANVDVPIKIYDARPSGYDIPMTMRNQKMLFGMDVMGRYLGAGNWKGEIAVFDVQKDEEALEGNVHEANADFKEPDFRFAAHGDAVGSVSFHPWKPQVLSVSGSRHWQEEDDSDEEDEESDDSEEEITTSAPQPVRREIVSFDSSVKVWNCLA